MALLPDFGQNMQNSIETRWFIPGIVPSEVVQWFHHKMVSTQPSRVDTYLHTPHTPNLGIKLREGRIEIKQRTFDRGLYRFHPDASGSVEGWSKWTFLINTESDLDIQGKTWVPVRKERMIRRYQVLPDGGIRAVPGWLLPLQRSSVEITNITLHDVSWWSLGFEVVGTDIDRFAALLSTTELAFRSSGFPPLSAEHSYSYPHWLDLMDPERFSS